MMMTRMMSKLDAVIIVRVPADRRRELEREAKKAGRDFSEHIRKRLDEPAPKPAPVPAKS